MLRVSSPSSWSNVLRVSSPRSNVLRVSSPNSRSHVLPYLLGPLGPNNPSEGVNPLNCKFKVKCAAGLIPKFKVKLSMISLFKFKLLLSSKFSLSTIFGFFRAYQMSRNKWSCQVIDKQERQAGEGNFNKKASPGSHHSSSNVSKFGLDWRGMPVLSVLSCCNPSRPLESRPANYS